VLLLTLAATGAPARRLDGCKLGPSARLAAQPRDAFLFSPGRSARYGDERVAPIRGGV